MLNKEEKEFIKKQLNMTSDKDFINIEQLVDGKSGACVYRIKIISKRKRDTGVYIVKVIDTKSQWYNYYNSEAVRSASIHNDSDKFERHLVKTKADEIIEDKHIIIYSYANSSELNSISLEKVKKLDQTECLYKISYEILHLFCDPIISYQYDGNFFERLLSYRLNENGSFETKIRSILENFLLPSINLKGELYPNPYYYIRNKSLWEENIKFPFFKSRMHGDLHRKNIIVSKNISLDNIQYVVIDYDSYQKECPILFDNAYLELSAYIDVFPNNNLQEWIELINEIIDYDIFSPSDFKSENMLSYITSGICRGIKNWGTQEDYINAQDSIRIQFIMARIAAGVNFFSKNAITNQLELQRLLLYAAINFKKLFSFINFEWEEEKTTRFVNNLVRHEYVDEIWENSKNFSHIYNHVLLTSDEYNNAQYEKILPLSRVDWSLIIDIGNKVLPDDIYSHIALKMNERRHVTYFSAEENNDINDISRKNCIWINAKNTENTSIGTLWKKTSQTIKKAYKSISTSYPLKPFIFVFDCQKSSKYAEHLIQFLIDNDNSLPKGSRFLVLGNGISDDDINTLRENDYHCFLYKYANLIDVADTINTYFLEENDVRNQEIILPALEHLSGNITPKEYANYLTTFEIIHAGLGVNCDEYDYGRSFYRGGEISWIDLSHNYDINVLPNYEDKLSMLVEILEKPTTRVQMLKLSHVAGAGGTTLSKRLLWDLKDRFPCIYLKKYTSQTADNIIEIYRKTGKSIFIVVESGSTVITEENITNLMTKVNADNAKAVFLLVERIHFFEQNEFNSQDFFILLKNELPGCIARKFLERYRIMTNERSRIQYLENITYHKTNPEWSEQSCPFFYGFYTFQEEYNINNFLKRTIGDCSEDVKLILSDLALITIYSQNICITFIELAKRLNITEDEMSPYLVHERLNEAVRKIMVYRENGWRLCNVLIAKKILQIIYDKGDFKESIYTALMGYIERIHRIYVNNCTYIESVIKELIIDRAYIDGEKTKFSDIIGDIDELIKKQEVFNTLIQFYPDNPHYYNHLGRLYIYCEPYQFEEAIEKLNYAISIADNTKEMSIHPHCTTLACIYSKKIREYLKNLRSNKSKGLYIPPINTILSEISCEYEKANTLFIESRKSNRHNSYGYFPNILMICTIIEGIINCDTHNRDLNTLLYDDKDFRAWYDENVGVAVNLVDSMEKNCYDVKESDFIKIAKSKLEGILENVDILKDRLSKMINNQSKAAIFSRRTCVGSYYSRKGYSWKKFKNYELELVEKNMRQNLYGSNRDDEYRGHDAYFWFEAYRRVDYFDESEAIHIISDFIPNDYQKSYLLYILEFSRYIKKVGKRSEVIRHMADCQKYSSQIYGLRTSAFLDAYKNEACNFPIIPIKYIERTENNSFIGLKVFTGTISTIEGTTKGKIIIDNLNLDATFTPSFVGGDGEKREFNSNNIGDNVYFNLMFTYSGLRAWNVTKGNKVLLAQ